MRRSAPQKRARESRPEEPVPGGELDAFRTSGRLCRHARNFGNCTPSKRQRLLVAYWKAASNWTPRKLQRHAVHVGAWLVLADSCTLFHTNAPLSSVDSSDSLGMKSLAVETFTTPDLFARLLAILSPRKQLRPWFRATLQLVQQRYEEIMASGELDDSWSRLGRHLLRFDIPSRSVGHDGKIGVDCDFGEDDAPCQKRVRLFQKAMGRWQNNDLAEQARRVEEIEQQFFCASSPANDETSVRNLRAVIREAVAALAPPRAHGVAESGDAVLDRATLVRSRTSAAIQERVREVLRRALEVWGHAWGAEQIMPMLVRLRLLVDCFEARHGSVHLACAGKQWFQLKAALELFEGEVSHDHGFQGGGEGSVREASVELTKAGRGSRYNAPPWSKVEWQGVIDAVRAQVGTGSDLPQPSAIRMADWRAIAKRFRNGRSAYSMKAHYRHTVDPSYARLEIPDVTRHERGLIGRMARKALQACGGYATCPEIVTCCRDDPEIRQEFWNRLNHHLTKIGGTKSELPSWEATLHTNIGKYALRTAVKKGTHAIWSLEWDPVSLQE
eukprot:TRINITY_DN44382_c0_g1_i1.p1 TRINITY_DN44382_c0_g1~~TRINITY_DN44382_c0_g1_i1.p1  ORF type:complete len:557 (+),score=78.71 TRINITY_DN44382_c0_g1_i1:95-1765(+)